MTKRRAIPKAVRNRVLVRATHRCCICPEHRSPVDLHHIVPISDGGDNTEENLIAVCPTCHADIHRTRNRYTPDQLRMYKERWERPCAQKPLPDVCLQQKIDHTQPPTPPRTGNLDAQVLRALYDYLQDHLGSPKMNFNELVGTVWAEKSNVIQCLMGLQEKDWLDYDLIENAEGGVVWLTQLGTRVAEDASGD